MIADYSEAPVCHVDDLIDGQLKEVRVNDTDVLLARADGQYYALYPKCAHYQAPLAKGVLNGNRLICPWHNACFDVRTGHRLEAPALNGLPMHEVRIEGDQVYVRLTTDKESRENPMATPDEANTETCVVVGGGGAGAFAAEGLREGGFTGRVILLTESEEGPYDRPNCSKNYLQGEAPDEWMPLRTEDFYTNYGIAIRTHQRVASLDAAAKEIVLASGEVLPYDQAVICSGGTPTRLTIPGADLPGVYTLRTLQDSRHLRELGQQGKRIVIIGSSFIGLEGAMSLRKLGSEIDMVGTETVPFAKVLGERIGRVIQGWHEQQGIRFHLGCKPQQFDGDSTVESVVLDTGERLAADAVLIGLGVKPQTGFLTGVTIEKDGSVKTDEYLQVTDSLYAAGDIAQYPANDGLQRIEHWKIAGQQGHTAGVNMARSHVGAPTQAQSNPIGPDEQAQPYRSVPFFWTNQQGKRINYVGHASTFDDIFYAGSPEEDDSFLALYLQDGQVKAAAGLKRDTDIIAIRELMQAGKMPSIAQIRQGIDWMDVLKKS
ncbi:FAD-dependent oxidoreductase [Spirosoma utsteinense]|uniref:NADPH-dependent 2,4-dienoyl-CoA reductase/sulfur reductase-like enzyme n=1 Tax=Spirosoma utsteinense TaxID=2585773 RepID=A0ABR6W192_9BACT|nr:FAD-dependent oxidoreductase [Spirosoma utsteinense]MBC3790305.1 NADPH-dependent 2,4-dienoyl-CoA reductase/sulfur reductase-like enzyme [Spirosoma utsteinense]